MPKHPHQECDEIFMGNHTDESFRTIPWKTKRYGLRAFDTDGKQLDIRGPLRPVFVFRTEVQAAFDQEQDGSLKKEEYAYMLEHGYERPSQ
jgi:hypothetical protein